MSRKYNALMTILEMRRSMQTECSRSTENSVPGDILVKDCKSLGKRVMTLQLETRAMSPAICTHMNFMLSCRYCDI